MLLKAMEVLIMLKFLNFFNLELQLNDTKSTIKNKFKKFLPELRGFKLVITLVFAFRNIESEDKTKYDNLYSSSKAEIVNYQ